MLCVLRSISDEHTEDAARVGPNCFVRPAADPERGHEGNEIQKKRLVVKLIFIDV